MYKVLIVDDENIVRVALRTIIDWEQYNFIIVGTANNGEEAFNFMKNQEIDLVVTDLKMPVLDGIQLIEKLKKENYKGEILILSNYDEFELVRKGLMLGVADYLLKFKINPENFAIVLENIKKKLEQNGCKQENIQILEQKQSELQIQEIWSNFLLKEKSIERIKSTQFDSDESFYLMNLFIEDIELNKQIIKDGKEKKLLHYGISNVLKDLFEYEDKLQFIPILKETIIIIYQKKNKQKFSPYEIAKQTKNLIQLYLNIVVSIVYTDCFYGIEEIRTQYKQSMIEMEYRFYTDCYIIKESIVKKEHKETNIEQLLDYTVYKEKILLCLSLMQRDQMKQITEEFLIQCKNKCVRPKELKLFLKQLLVQYIQTIMGLDATILTELGEFEDIMTSFDSNSLCKIMIKYYNLCLELYKKKKQSNYRTEVITIIEFINKNIDKKITLAMIANYVNMNESYMCTIFKEQVNKSIISYINEMKMREAAKLLISTDDLLRDVAKQVGIVDQFYFNRLFKKYYKVTPSKYRQQREEGEEL